MLLAPEIVDHLKRLGFRGCGRSGRPHADLDDRAGE
jgi:hypothetical protein